MKASEKYSLRCQVHETCYERKIQNIIHKQEYDQM